MSRVLPLTLSPSVAALARQTCLNHLAVDDQAMGALVAQIEEKLLSDPTNPVEVQLTWASVVAIIERIDTLGVDNRVSAKDREKLTFIQQALLQSFGSQMGGAA